MIYFSNFAVKAFSYNLIALFSNLFIESQNFYYSAYMLITLSFNSLHYFLVFSNNMSNSYDYLICYWSYIWSIWYYDRFLSDI